MGLLFEISSTRHGRTTIHSSSEVDVKNIKSLLLLVKAINTVADINLDAEYMMENISSLHKGEFISIPAYVSNKNTIWLKFIKQ